MERRSSDVSVSAMEITVIFFRFDAFSVDLSRFKSAIIPVLMMNESVDMDDETVDELHSKLLSVQSASFAAAWFLLILSFVLFGLAIYIYFYLVSILFTHVHKVSIENLHIYTDTM